MLVENDKSHRPHMSTGALEDHTSDTAIGHITSEREGCTLTQPRNCGFAKEGDGLAQG